MTDSPSPTPDPPHEESIAGKVGRRRVIFVLVIVAAYIAFRLAARHADSDGMLPVAIVALVVFAVLHLIWRFAPRRACRVLVGTFRKLEVTGLGPRLLLDVEVAWDEDGAGNHQPVAAAETATGPRDLDITYSDVVAAIAPGTPVLARLPIGKLEVDLLLVRVPDGLVEPAVVEEQGWGVTVNRTAGVEAYVPPGLDLPAMVASWKAEQAVT